MAAARWCLVACGVLSLARSGVADVATWTGAGGSSWSEATSWDPTSVPCNGPAASYDVILPPGVSTQPAVDLACVVDSVSLAPDAMLGLPSGSLDATACTLDGLVDGSGGAFRCGASGALAAGTGRLRAANGSVLEVGATTWTSSGVSGPATLVESSGAASRVSLPALVSLDASFAGSGSGDVHALRAAGGGIELPALVSTAPPQTAEDRLDLLAEAGGSILLSSLQNISGAGAGHTRLRATGSAISLPALESATDVILEALAGGSISTAGGPPFTYSTSNLGLSPFATRTILLADGTGSLLDLPTATTLDAGYFSDFDMGGQAIRANGGAIDLSGVTHIVAPAFAYQTLSVVVNGGGSVDLASLDSIDPVGSGTGDVDFLLNHGDVRVGRASAEWGLSIEIDDNAGPSRMEVLGDVSGRGVSILISGGTSELDVGSNLIVHKYLAANGTRVRVGGDVDYVGTPQTPNALDQSVLHMDGAGSQRLHVGGVDRGLPVAIFPGDFRIGQLVVEGETTRLACLAEATGASGGLYLTGLDPAGELAGNPLGLDGLRVLDGATLALGNIDAYARLSGTWTHLNALVPPSGSVAFDGGFLTIGDSDGDGVSDATDNCLELANATQADADGDRVGDACDNCVQIANPRPGCGFLATNQWASLTGGQRDDDRDGYGNRCDAKFPGVPGSFVGAGDVAQLRASLGKSRGLDNCGADGTRPCAVFDLDEGATFIGAADVAVFRARLGKLPGPKCASCPLTPEPATPVWFVP